MTFETNVEKNRFPDRQVISIIIAIFIVLASVGVLFYGEHPNLLFAVFGLYAGAIVLLPALIDPEYDLFSTWTFVCLSVILGSTIRGFYISAGYPDSDTLEYLFFRGQSADYFVWPAILVLTCLLFMALTYAFIPAKKSLTIEHLVKFRFDEKKVRIFAYLSLAVSLVCIFAYVRLTGGFSMLNLSKKRTLIESVNLAESHRTWQSLRLIASVSMIAHLLILIDAIRSIGVDRIRKFGLAIVLFLAAVFIPFYASSRGIVFMYGIFSLATGFYVKQSFSTRNLFFVGIAAVFVFQVMTILRVSDDMSVSEAIRDTSLTPKILDRLVLNRNDLELAKSAHIMNAIPDHLSLQYGQTIAAWFVAPIPREIWNDKPMVSSGPIIGTVIYKNKISGVPPGFVGEMFWNFHILGVLFGGVFLGWLLKWVQVNFSPSKSPSSSMILIYVFGPMQIGYLIIGTAFGYGCFTAGINTLYAMLALYPLRESNV